MLKDTQMLGTNFTEQSGTHKALHFVESRCEKKKKENNHICCLSKFSFIYIQIDALIFCGLKLTLFASTAFTSEMLNSLIGPSAASFAKALRSLPE